MPEPLVFLPGMMCDGRLYGPQIKALGRDRAIHLAPICAHETVEALATEVLASAPPTFALAGLSMGGIVAMEVVRRAPARVTRLALMDTNALAETPAYAAAREPQIARVMAGSLVEVMREEMKPDYLAPGAGRQAVLDLVMDMALDMGEGVFLRQSRALQRRPDQQNVLRKLKIPTLILCGEHDRLCPVARHQFMADLIFRATLVVVPDAGHLPTLEQPEAVNAALKQWLAA
ncbi:Pimeloyl-ACP methyl ester carboxylesterase [Litoreibacter ascidiaceicola]|uniref:Pimeloyl-ACP methyl ester carboxylesterase n=1 Tax=Litoreibacter ascidiaceicola TaxID=1486859 RepID=A0A1M4TF68_9RHOB|nr:alpha/beta fold hydrolase [Litoreibacter ascidiaceicola]SHE43189.1 Pimeloyl-ACP methyl ester carboxylesterase [Litoreibacter ascidiaceicola]